MNGSDHKDSKAALSLHHRPGSHMGLSKKNAHMSWHCRAMLLALCLAVPPQLLAQSYWVVGGQDTPWQEQGRLEALDTTVDPGRLQPIRIVLDQNLARGDAHRVTRAYSLQPSIQSLGGLEYMIDGDPDTAFEMRLEATVGSSVILDLGAVLPVSLIRFYSRRQERFRDRFLRAYQVTISDMRPSPTGQIMWDLAATNWDNTESVVSIPVANRFVREIRIQALTTLPWEIAEWEVHGQGYTPSATYTSEPIDFGGLANLGLLDWAVEKDPAASVTMVTRSGNDDSPYTYYRLSRPEPGVVDTVEVTRQVYETLGAADRLQRFDTENWSFWSAPYPATGPAPIVSPAPRRYFQFQLRFESAVFTDRAIVDSVTIEYSSPPLAQRVIAEVYPDMVEAGEPTQFTYALTPVISPGDQGFDALTVSTPMRADLGELRIDGQPTAYAAEVTDSNFTVIFSPVRHDGALVELTFHCQVLVYGTVFSGQVFDSQSADLPQEIVEGDASPAYPSRRLSVGVTELTHQVLARVDAHPAVFAPNGDGVDDRTAIRYQLQKLLRPARLEITIYDLSGARLWNKTLQQSSGVYQVEWDGRDSHGRLAPPGIYVFRVTAHTASGDETKAGTVCVAY